MFYTHTHFVTFTVTLHNTPTLAFCLPRSHTLSLCRKNLWPYALRSRSRVSECYRQSDTVTVIRYKWLGKPEDYLFLFTALRLLIVAHPNQLKEKLITKSRTSLPGQDYVGRTSLSHSQELFCQTLYLVECELGVCANSLCKHAPKVHSHTHTHSLTHTHSHSHTHTSPLLGTPCLLI